MRAEGAGLEQAAVAMLRTLGAGRASLLVPQPVASNSQTGLGIGVPMANEVGMEPVLLHTSVDGNALLALAARPTVHKALSSVGGLDATATLERSMLRANGKQYRIVMVAVKQFGGVELMYEMEIEAIHAGG